MMRFHQAMAGRRWLFGLAALVLIAAGPAAPARAAGEPEAVVDTLVHEIIGLLSAGELTRTGGLERLAGTIEGEADLSLLARLALGRHWREASEEQRSEYERLFTELMLRKFAGHLGAYSGQDLGPEGRLFEITGSRSVSGGDVVVDSIVRPPNRNPINVAWRLRDRDSTPVIIDIVVADVSLLITQRSEFDSVIGQRGIDGLLAELRARLERGEPT